VSMGLPVKRAGGLDRWRRRPLTGETAVHG
jgi:hypothetical protein